MGNEHESRRFSFVKDLPVWIQTVVGVITVLVLLGFIRVATGPDDAPAPTPTPTPTPTESAADPDRPADAGGVYWSGSVEFAPGLSTDGAFSFDVRPPRYVQGRSLWRDAATETMIAFEGSTVLLAEWPEVSTPSRADCLAKIRMDGLVGAGTLSSGSQICGATVEGRPFLIQSQRIDSGDVMYAEVTVWNP